LPSLRRGRSDWLEMLHSLAALYAAGSSVDWSGFDRDYSRRRVVLPTYPFQRQRYWVQSSDNGHSPAPPPSPLVKLLEQGDTQSLAQLLSQTANLSEDQSKWLPELLNLLVEHHQRQQSTASIQDWLYQLEWQPKPHSSSFTPEPEPGLWLILADAGGVARALADLLNQHGHSSVLAYAPGQFQKNAPRAWSLNPASPEDFDRLRREAIAGPLPLGGIIHLWALQSPPPQTLTVESLEQAQLLTCGALLHLVQLIKPHASSSPRL